MAETVLIAQWQIDQTVESVLKEKTAMGIKYFDFFIRLR